MNEKQQEQVMEVVELEGFEYAFCDYSNFEEIEDEEFHEARKAYKEAAARLKAIIGW